MTDSAKVLSMMGAVVLLPSDHVRPLLRPLPFNWREKTPEKLAAEELRSIRALTTAQAKRSRKRAKIIKEKRND